MKKTQKKKILLKVIRTWKYPYKKKYSLLKSAFLKLKKKLDRL